VDNSGAKFSSTQNVGKGGSYTVNNTSTGIPTDALTSILSAVTGGSAAPTSPLFNPVPAPTPAAPAPDTTGNTAASLPVNWSKYYWIGYVLAALFALNFLFRKR